MGGLFCWIWEPQERILAWTKPYIQCLTSAAPRRELRVDLADNEGNYKYAQYYFFSLIGNSGTNYRLNIAGYTGTAGDSLTHHNGMQFSTSDNNNHDRRDHSCANDHHGAWWYNACRQPNLNGRYRSGSNGWDGVVWHTFLNNQVSLKFAQMKLHFRD